MDIERTPIANSDFHTRTSKLVKMVRDVSVPLLQRIDEFKPHRETDSDTTVLLREAATEIRNLEAKLAELLPWALMGAEMLKSAMPSVEDIEHAMHIIARINAGEFGEMP